MAQRILIIDDQQDILDLLLDILQPQGFEVITLHDADNILKEIEKIKPDLVVLDFLLAGINGGEFCAQIKKNPVTQHVPVILLSAHPRVLNSLGHYGYDEFIAKPFDVDTFLKIIQKYI
jgi:DNA-binding response OmpR family regulator